MFHRLIINDVESKAWVSNTRPRAETTKELATPVQRISIAMIPENDDSRAKAVEHSPVRCELLNWFRVNALSLAEAYEGAIRLVDDCDLPGRIHFISRVVRDISNVLPVALDPQSKGGQVQYKNDLDRIAPLWRRTDVAE